MKKINLFVRNTLSLPLFPVLSSFRLRIFFPTTPLLLFHFYSIGSNHFTITPSKKSQKSLKSRNIQQQAIVFTNKLLSEKKIPLSLYQILENTDTYKSHLYHVYENWNANIIYDLKHLLHLYSNCGDGVRSVIVFNELLRRRPGCMLNEYGLVTHAFARRGDLSNSWLWYEKWKGVLMVTLDRQQSRAEYLKQLESYLVGHVFNPLIAAAASAENMRFFQLVLKEMEYFQVNLDLRSLTSVVGLCGKLGMLKEAENWMKRTANPDSILYSSLFNAYAANGDRFGAINVLKRMKDDSVEVTKWMLSSANKLLAGTKNNDTKPILSDLADGNLKIDEVRMIDSLRSVPDSQNVVKFLKDLSCLIADPLDLRSAISYAASRLLIEESYDELDEFVCWILDVGGNINYKAKCTLIRYFLENNNWNSAWRYVLSAHTTSEVDEVTLCEFLRAAFNLLPVSKKRAILNHFFIENEIHKLICVGKMDGQLQYLFETLPTQIRDIISLFHTHFGVLISQRMHQIVIRGLRSLRLFEAMDDYMQILVQISFPSQQLDFKTLTTYLSSISKKTLGGFNHSKDYINLLPDVPKDLCMITALMRAHTQQIVNIKQQTSLIATRETTPEEMPSIQEMIVSNNYHLQIIVSLFRYLKEHGGALTPDIITYSVMISAFKRVNDVRMVLNTFANMVQSGIEPTLQIYTTLLSVGAWNKNLLDVHWNEMTKAGIKPDVVAVAIRVRALCMRQDMSAAKDLVNSMRNLFEGSNESVTVYTALARGIWEGTIKKIHFKHAGATLMKKSRQEIVEIAKVVCKEGILDSEFIATVRLAKVLIYKSSESDFKEIEDLGWMDGKGSAKSGTKHVVLEDGTTNLYWTIELLNIIM
ncbi:hypothetical protein HK098_005992 [Nowakowskiella sp. JEL0407]|nr:hypothetical protein HK098_005992 [Nowakowskiella sp. JEL0407]